MAHLFSAAALAYPLILHACVWTQNLAVAVYYLAILLAIPLASDVVGHRRISVYGIVCATLSLALLTVLRSYELLLFKLLPVTIHGVFFWVFASSLRPGVTPVVTRIATAMQEELGEEEARYTRSVTIAWSVFFITMGLISGYLALFSNNTTWSWFVNVISYCLVALFFLVEFVLRTVILGDHIDYSFMDFMMRLRRIDFRKLFWSR